MTKFNVVYWSTYENNNKPPIIEEGTVFHPQSVKWIYENNTYEFVRNDKDVILNIYVSQKFILVYYDDSSTTFPAPYNLVLYNLKKQMLKTITSPQSINVEGSLPYIGVSGEKLMIDGVEHMKIALGYDSGPERIREFRYLNLETFEFHPTENIFWDWIDER